MLYRGIIVGVNDPDKRYRYQVRVNGIDYENVPGEGLRWSEYVPLFAAKLAGDIPNFDIGDEVWVMCEGGDLDYLVVVGGWINSSLGVNDVPTGNMENYSVTRKRWLRVDRIGNCLEMSEVPYEQWIKMISGACSIQVSQNDNSIRIYAKSGLTDINAATMKITAEQQNMQAAQFFMTAQDFDSFGRGTGLMQLLSNYKIDMNATGLINIGGYVPTYNGATVSGVPGMAAQQSPVLNLLASDVNSGAATGDTQGTPGLPLRETGHNRVKGKSIRIMAAPTSLNPFPSIPVEILINAVNGDITVSTDQDIILTGNNVSVTATTKATVTAPDVEVTATSTAKVTSPDTEVDGNMTVNGNLHVTGAVLADGEVTGGSAAIPLSLHTHLYSPGPGSPTPTAVPAP